MKTMGAPADPTRSLRRLQLLNLARWIREHVLFWGFLSLIYSLTVTMILQPLLEKAFKRELPVAPLWLTTCALLIVPALLEALPLPPLGRVVKPGALSEGLWRWGGGSLGQLYLRHELRRGTTWFVVLIVVLIGQLLPERLRPLWILAAQLPVQRALYSIHRWRGVALTFSPAHGAARLISALWAAQTIEVGVAWIALGLSQVMPLEQWLKLGPAALAACIASGALAMEGDSGRPWIVNFMALAAGILAGFLSYNWWWVPLLVIYVAMSMRGAVVKRLQSVEHLDEDTLIS